MGTPQLPASNIITDQAPYPFSALTAFIRRLIAMLFGAGASTVVWRPGAVSSGNVFGTWAEVVAAVGQLNGSITIGVDTDTAPAIIPPGAYNLTPAGVSGPRILVNASKASPFIAPFITLGPGAVTIAGLSALDGVSIVNQSTVPVITFTDNKSFSIEKEGGVFQDVGAAAFIAVTATGFVDLLLKGFAQIINFGGTNAITVAAGGVLTIKISDSAEIGPGMLVAAAGTTGVTVDYFALYGTQPGAPTTDPQVRESGSAAILVGTGKTAAIPAFITPTTRIIVCLKTPSGDALTVKYAAIDADRVNGAPGSFKISALAAAGGGAINGVDVSTIDWFTTFD